MTGGFEAEVFNHPAPRTADEAMDWVFCPFDKNHYMPKARLQWHIYSCRLRADMNKYKCCPYNELHWFPKEQLQSHIDVCTDKPLDDREVYVEVQDFGYGPTYVTRDASGHIVTNKDLRELPSHARVIKPSPQAASAKPAATAAAGATTATAAGRKPSQEKVHKTPVGYATWDEFEGGGKLSKNQKKHLKRKGKKQMPGQEDDDDDEEEEVEDDKRWKVGDICEGQFSDDNQWYRAHIDKVTSNGKYIVTYLDYGNSEESEDKYLRPLSTAAMTGAPPSSHAVPTPSLAATTLNAPVKPLPRWREGDICEGQFSEDNQWYQVYINHVHPDGTYTVTYIDHGNSEVSEDQYLRPISKPPTSQMSAAREPARAAPQAVYARPTTVVPVSAPPSYKSFPSTSTAYSPAPAYPSTPLPPTPRPSPAYGAFPTMTELHHALDHSQFTNGHYRPAAPRPMLTAAAGVPSSVRARPSPASTSTVAPPYARPMQPSAVGSAQPSTTNGANSSTVEQALTRLATLQQRHDIIHSLELRAAEGDTLSETEWQRLSQKQAIDAEIAQIKRSLRATGQFAL